MSGDSSNEKQSCATLPAVGPQPAKTLVEMPNKTHRMNGTYCDNIKQGMYCFKLQPPGNSILKEKSQRVLKKMDDKKMKRARKFTLYTPYSCAKKPRVRNSRLSLEPTQVKNGHNPSLEDRPTKTVDSDGERGEREIDLPPLSEGSPRRSPVQNGLPSSPATYQTVVTIDDSMPSPHQSTPTTPVTPVMPVSLSLIHI